MPNLSQHAYGRAQQRSIPPMVMDLLQDFGASARVRGADTCFFDQSARRRLRAELGVDRCRFIEQWLNTYVVVADDGSVITVARRTRRLRRH